MLPRPTLATQLDAVIYYLQIMDTEMLATLLERQESYQDFDRYIFIKKLDAVFDVFRQDGVTHLLVHEGKCNACMPDGLGYLFKGNVGKKYISFIFEIDDQQNITDFYECNDFTRAKQEAFRSRVILDLPEGYVDMSNE